jgi:putative DNA primase/helicase
MAIINASAANLADIPQKLKDWPGWVLWKYDKKQGKVPYIAGKGIHKASSTDPTTWHSFEETLKVLTSRHGESFDGAGICIEGSDIVGLDLDNATERGELAWWAEELIAQVNSYAEVSPSGRGIRIFVLGDFTGAGIKIPSVGAFSDGTRF